MAASKFTTTPSPIEVVEKVNAVIDDVAGKASTANMTGASDSSAGKSGLVPAPAVGDQDKFLSGAGTWKAVQTIIDFVYPVGSLYWSKKSTDPGTLFGGTWTRVKDKFILAAGDSYAQGATGGEATVTLTTNQIPSHTHSASSNSTGAHAHDLSVKYGTQGSSSWNAFGKSYNNYQWVDDKNSYTISTTGAHSHTISVNNTGGGAAHNNMPPYVAYYCWERTA